MLFSYIQHLTCHYGSGIVGTGSRLLLLDHTRRLRQFSNVTKQIIYTRIIVTYTYLKKLYRFHAEVRYNTSLEVKVELLHYILQHNLIVYLISIYCHISTLRLCFHVAFLLSAFMVITTIGKVILPE